MARSLNRVQLIGNLTRDPELRYTPSGSAVCTFGIATNRSWTTDSGEKREEVDFHKVVAWNKLAELCSQFMSKGRKVYVEGRLSTRTWTAQDGSQKSTTEVIIDNMILLDTKQSGGSSSNTESEPIEVREPDESSREAEKAEPKTEESKAEKTKKPVAKKSDEEVAPDDIPF